ncbi:SDR family oxidoreductase [Faecalicatena sp. AGMB00832]|uniref:SDR family oxidoreductase n=1 Tax=Faecalicatena faecalis TaxID=2726362 RepID=A0ABS6D1G5_9FIRM|nr:SDR family oxidoreductase [Faecalicatena faecalis]MBU3875170.1 SDR family oxidoreductase [Faecalicatena faecalis]
MEKGIEFFSLEGKKAIVTGGAQGLCYAMAEALHEAGAEIVLLDVQKSVYESAARLGERGAHVHAVMGDLSDYDQLVQAYQACLGKLGGHLDILLNGAGIQFRCKAEDYPRERWEKILDINLSAVFYMAQMAGRTMLEQGSGKIINIASMTAYVASAMIPAYAASKAGVVQITKALSNEWSSRGVNVNAIAPGYMATKLTEDMKQINPALYTEITGRIPMGRWGNPEDLKGAAVFLASGASDYISGITLPVDGGYLGK